MLVLICWKIGKTTENLQETQIFPDLVSKEKKKNQCSFSIELLY